jgi:tetratricopeptide (TPR) repeat protein
MKRAMISSTSIDLPEHRKQVIEACQRMDFFPEAMEHLPARDADAIRVSLEMVGKADLYLGIFAWRYGHIPEGQEVSITELEFNRAIECSIPILVFTIHQEHQLTIGMVETSEAAQRKLGDLKERACHGRGRREFRSPADLRAEVLHALADLKQSEQQAPGNKPAPSFHRPSDIPSAPARYVAHPYTLLQTAEVIGRREELSLLTDWVTRNKSVAKNTRLFCVVAIGGMGKSALTWKWFEDIAPNELPKLAGRMWWSFYESDAHYENFLLRALAYVTGMSETEARGFTAREREDRLLRVLDEQPFLLVLDGLERILLAYARLDAARLADDDLDDRTANQLAGAMGLPAEARETYLEKHRLRRCTDPRAGEFLKKLTRVRASYVLVSTRLYPAELQNVAARPLPGCYPLFLSGLTEDDALALWRGFIGGERSGTSAHLLPLFRAFGFYPLLLRALAGEVAEYKPAPGDFDRWRRDHPQFDPSTLPLKNARTHVLHFALRGLGEAPRRVLHTLAAFCMPTTWDTLGALLMGEGKPCPDARSLDAALTELEDRGFVGWDKAANRYDLHPIVRSVVWTLLDPSAKRGLYLDLNAYFQALPAPQNWRTVKSVDDLTGGIELFNSLVGLLRYEEAYELFNGKLEAALLTKLNAGEVAIELLEQLSPVLTDMSVWKRGNRLKSLALFALALAHDISGQPAKASSYYDLASKTAEESEDRWQVTNCLSNLALALWPCGKLHAAERAARRALKIRENSFPRTYNLRVLGIILAICGENLTSERLLQSAQRRHRFNKDTRSEGAASSLLAQNHLWRGQAAEALRLAEDAWRLAQFQKRERDLIRAARIKGSAELHLGDFSSAEHSLKYALNRARSVGFVQEELPALTALVELELRRNQYETALGLLDQIWSPAERGPYPLWHADARNVLAQLERDLGHRDAAMKAAIEAYRLAWCDGPPYAYAPALARARQHLQELGAPEPQLPPFDPAKFPPLPEVELNPHDEFHVDA